MPRRRCTLDYNLVEGILAANRPLVLVGAVRTWPAIRKWSWAFLRSVCGDLEVPVRWSATSDRQSVRLAALLDHILSCRDPGTRGPRGQCVDWNIYGDLPELARDVDIPAVAADDWLQHLPPSECPRARRLYLCSAGFQSRLHQDILGTHGWLAQIRGRTRFVLYPPDAFSDGDAETQDAFAQDAADRDRQAERPRYEAWLETGDLIFIPSLWWHQVSNPEPTIGLAGNFVNHTNYAAVRAGAMRGQFSHLVPRLDAIASLGPAIGVTFPW